MTTRSRSSSAATRLPRFAGAAAGELISAYAAQLKGAKCPLLPLPDEIEVEAKAMHVHLCRARQGEAAARRVRGVVEVERLAAAVARSDAFDLERQNVGDHGRALQPIQIEFYGLVGDATEVADQVFADEGGRAARLPADDCGKCLALRLIRALVDNAGEDPVAVGHDFAGADHQRELQPIEADSAAASGIDPKH